MSVQSYWMDRERLGCEKSSLALRFPHESHTIYRVAECQVNLPSQGLQMRPRIGDFA